jgi:hypothetical protein
VNILSPPPDRCGGRACFPGHILTLLHSIARMENIKKLFARVKI